MSRRKKEVPNYVQSNEQVLGGDQLVHRVCSNETQSQWARTCCGLRTGRVVPSNQADIRDFIAGPSVDDTPTCLHCIATDGGHDAVLP